MGRGARQDSEVSSTEHSLTLYYVPGTGLGATLGEEPPEASCQTACSAMEFSSAFPYFRSVFVTREDLLAGLCFFISEKPLTHGAWVRGRGEREEIWPPPYSEQMGSEQRPSASPAKMPEPWRLSQDTDNGV